MNEFYRMGKKTTLFLRIRRHKTFVIRSAHKNVWKDDLCAFNISIKPKWYHLSYVTPFEALWLVKTIDDENILSAYNVAVVDLNSDGNKQLLVNNHETKDKKTGIWAYEFPNDIMNDEWTRQTIASDFHNAFSLTVPNMSPGYTYAIYPNGYHDNERAHILVAGDGDHKAHALYPSGDSSVFEYTDTVFSDAKGTVGAMTFSDLDEDGWQEVWVANYDKGYVELFELSDASSSVE